jgi:tRNA uridine 5-carboxymethylaminomethyl modification enzyme
MKTFDVIIIGGGHAGCEAAYAAAKMGCSAALLSLNLERIGFMPCNPAIGGLAKGQLVKEIDALGGLMGRITDLTAIQYRRLNSSKGPAVRSSRAQCDKELYALRMQEFLKTVPGLTLVQGEASEILTDSTGAIGIELKDGSQIHCKAIVLTSGTFLKGMMYTGFDKTEGGRFGDQASVGLSGSLSRLGFRLRRLKTGTPPRLHKKSIDYSRTEVQFGDERPVPFSFFHTPDPFPFLAQVQCYITYTNEQTHSIIEQNFSRSPMFSGLIEGVGPRYCPSVEDKVNRFRDKQRHQIFLEPEGLTTDEVYANGISTSLPWDVQEKFVRSIVGLEQAEFIRYGYAVEYDSIDARQLRATFESKDVPGLFFAGQVNGTSGYEEAGAQGLIAGINAALKVQNREPHTFSRADGYLGVLADDLVLKGSDEPYRMFTSRAEYRLLLREDNADLRLSELGWKLGLLGDREYRTFEVKRNLIEQWKRELAQFNVMPTDEFNRSMQEKGLNPIKDRVAGDVFLRRPEVNWSGLCELGFQGHDVPSDVQEQVEIQIKYEGYIRRDLELLEGVRKSESIRIPSGLDFNIIAGLSNEIKNRLNVTRPETIGQASRMMGMTPAAVANLLIFLKMQAREAKVNSSVSSSLQGA